MATIVAGDATYAEVAAAIAAASEGDTVTVPAGTETWNSEMTITKGITFQGAGTGNTNITCGFSNSNSGLIAYRADATSRAADNLMRITGFSLDINDESTNGIYVKNESTTPVTKVRIDSNAISNSSGRGIYVIGTVYGVGHGNAITDCYHDMDTEGHNSGIPQWTDLTRAFGSANNFYWEDNTVIGNGSVLHAAGHGGRYVSRYNNYTNSGSTKNYPVFDMHGNQPDDICATMISEIYGNDIDMYGGRIIDERGGMLMAFFNKITWNTDGANIHVREEYLDSNYPEGNSWVMHPTNSYYWNIRENGSIITTVELSSNGYEDTYDLAQNVDFWMQNASYNGTTEIGVYVGASLPEHCTIGDGAWITAQSTSDLTGLVGVSPATPISGTFYKATAEDVWTEYYTPYTYPHPLRGVSFHRNRMRIF